MTQKNLIEEINNLKKRVEELEKKTVFVPHYQPYLINPTYPQYPNCPFYGPIILC